MKKILIVEDDKIFALSLKLSLTKYGYEVLKPVDNAEEGFQSAMTYKPDIILMDILLKGNETGIDAALQINNNAHIPIIFMTGNEDLLGKEKFLNLKKYYVYSKPVDEEILIEAIEKII
jgi:DNA-binding NarL/FixJ family response regulator